MSDFHDTQFTDAELAKIETMIRADGAIVADKVLKRGRSPDVALAILGAAVEDVLSRVPPDRRGELERRFFGSFEG